jgi:hypothetical protein
MPVLFVSILNLKTQSALLQCDSKRANTKERVIGIEPTTFSLGSCKQVDGITEAGDVYDNQFCCVRTPHSSMNRRRPSLPGSLVERECDSELELLVERWHLLSDSIRSQIIAVVQASE